MASNPQKFGKPAESYLGIITNSDKTHFKIKKLAEDKLTVTPEVYTIRKNSLQHSIKERCLNAEAAKNLPNFNVRGPTSYLNEILVPEIISKLEKIEFTISNKQPLLSSGKISVKNLKFVNPNFNEQGDGRRVLLEKGVTTPTITAISEGQETDNIKNNDKCPIGNEVGIHFSSQPTLLPVAIKLEISNAKVLDPATTSTNNHNDDFFTTETVSLKKLLNDTIKTKEEKLLDEKVTNVVCKLKKELERGQMSGENDEAIVFLSLFEDFIENVRELKSYT